MVFCLSELISQLTIDKTIPNPFINAASVSQPNCRLGPWRLKRLGTPECEGPPDRGQCGLEEQCVLKDSQYHFQDCHRKDAVRSWSAVGNCWHPSLSNPNGRADRDRVDQGHIILRCMIYRRVVKCNVLFTKSMFPNLIQSLLSTGRDSADQEITASVFFPVSGSCVRLCIRKSHRGTDEGFL